MDINNITFLDNNLKQWIYAIALFLALYIVLLIVKRILIRRYSNLAAQEPSDIQIMLADSINKTHWLFLLIICLYIGSLLLKLPQEVNQLIRSVTIVVILVQIGFWGGTIIDYLVSRRIVPQTGDFDTDRTTVRVLRLASKVILWTIIILLVLENATGIELNSLIASLGLAGLAAALAVQNVLGDFFAAFSIALDRPFAIGDFVVVGDLRGTVEDIGLKSTRVRSVTGEQLIFSNSDLLSSRIRNYKTLERRMILFTLSVIYQTPPDKLARIPEMIKTIIETYEFTSFDRAHFKQYADSSLDFEVVYFMDTPDFYTYMDTQQAINLAIYEHFEAEGIEFAYPTQTVYQKDDPK